MHPLKKTFLLCEVIKGVLLSEGNVQNNSLKERQMRYIMQIGIFLLLASNLLAEDRFYVSPDVHEDRSVTFTVDAPEANKVSVELFEIGKYKGEKADLIKSDDGLWSITLGPFEPEIYYYLFETDGSKHCDYRNQHVKSWLKSVSIFEILGNPRLLHEYRDVDHGIMQSRFYRSKLTEKQRPVNIYLPPNYSIDNSYPVLFLLHGFGGTNRDWIEYGKVGYIIDNMLADGLIEPMILIMPDCHPNGRAYVNNEEPQWSTYKAYNLKNNAMLEEDIIKSLLPFVSKHYSVKTSPQYRAILGVSMSGEQAIEIGFHHLDEFGSIISLSGAFLRKEQYETLSAFNDEKEEAMTKLNLFWLGYGQSEIKNFSEPEKFHAWLEEQGIRHVWSCPEGGHEWDTWRRELCEILPVLFKKQHFPLQSGVESE